MKRHILGIFIIMVCATLVAGCGEKTNNENMIETAAEVAVQ